MKNIKISIVGLLLMVLGWNAQAQVPAPGPAQSKPIVLLGATAHLGNGQVIEKAAVAFTDGVLTDVVAESAFSGDLSQYDAVRLDGKHIYPGFIIPSTDLGLVEINAVRATRDNNETGTVNPNIRSIVSYNTDSEVIPTMRFNGILLAQTTPQGGVVSGTSSVVHMDAWNWEDAAVKMDDALHLNWPRRFRNQWDLATFTVSRVKNNRYKEVYSVLEKAFEDAIAYKEGSPVKSNLKMEAMVGLFDGTKALNIHVDEAREIVDAVKFAQKYGVQKIVVVGAEDAYEVRQFLKDNNIPVVVADIHRLPGRRHEDYNLPYKLAGMLHKAGVTVALSYNGVSNARNLPFYAGTTVAHGEISKEEAVQLITSNPAKILGIDDKFGTLEKGKSATLFVSTGDALDMMTNNMEHVFIEGRKVTLPAMQQELFEKYKAKYQSQK